MIVGVDVSSRRIDLARRDYEGPIKREARRPKAGFSSQHSAEAGDPVGRVYPQIKEAS